jgi:hypothetical protein
VIVFGVGGGVFGSGNWGSSSGTSATTTTQQYGQHPENVQITQCKADADGYLSGQVTVTNNSSGPSDYAIQVTFNSNDGATQYETGFVLVSSLAPGQTSGPQDLAVFKHVGNVQVSCKLASARRTAS